MPASSSTTNEMPLLLALIYIVSFLGMVIGFLIMLFLGGKSSEARMASADAWPNLTYWSQFSLYGGFLLGALTKLIDKFFISTKR
jgi:heme/copper-type cytochrome/quinol oxidase subunit 1